MGRNVKVERPKKKSEYEIQFGSAQAQKGWRDLCATIRNAMVETWDFLTRSPLERTPQNYPLKGELGKVGRDGKFHDRWQHKPTLGGSARIWFYVVDQVVILENVHTHHPADTK